MTKHYHSTGLKLSKKKRIYGDASKKTNRRGVGQGRIFMPSLATTTDNLAIIYAMIYLADTSSEVQEGGKLSFGVRSVTH